MRHRKNIANHLFIAISLILLTLVLYGETIHYDYVWDDIPFIRENELIKDLKNIPYFFSNGMPTKQAPIHYRPLSMFFFLLDHFFWGNNPSGFHLTNIILHTINTVLVYLFLLSFFESKIAILATLIFAAHPVHCDAVAWIMARGDIICGLFIILALISYINKKGIIASLFFVFALLSKEMAVTYPLIALSYSMLVEKDWKRGVKYALINISILGVYLILRANILEMPFGEKQPFITRLSTSITLMPKYIKMVVFPFDLSLLYHGLPVYNSLANNSVIISGALISLIVALAIIAKKKSPLAAFAICFFFISLLPVSGLPALIDVAMIAERYMYIPMIAVTLLIGEGLNQAVKNNIVRFRNVFVTIMVITTLLAVITYNRKQLWKNEFIFLTKMVEDAPYYHEAKAVLAYHYIQRGELDEAERQLMLALKIKPDYPEGLNTLGTVYLRKGKYDIAKELFEKAIFYKFDHPEAHSNLAIVYAINKRFDDAEREFKIAISLKQDFFKAYLNLAKMYIQQSRLEDAEKVILKAKTVSENKQEILKIEELLFQEKLRYENK